VLPPDVNYTGVRSSITFFNAFYQDRIRSAMSRLASDSMVVRRRMLHGMILLILSSVLIIAMLSPIEPIDLVYFALSSGLNVAPEVLLLVSDMLLLLAGFFIASSLRIFLSVGGLMSSRLMVTSELLSRVNRVVNRKGWPSLAGAALIIAFWHVPANLDAALLDYGLHWIMHVSIFFAGVLIYVGFTRLTLGMRLLTYLLGCKAMLILGAYMLVSPIVVYGSYPYPEQVEAGAAMVAMCLASDATIIPLWARRYFKN
jgi:cytochrome c oxidase assembly factor CtaG